MHYILDGYNVIGASQSISLSQTDKEERLIQVLSDFIKHNKHKITVVFDGRHPDFKWQSHYDKEGVQVVFTDAAESADDYIIRKIKQKQNKQAIIVVTSDRQIIDAAKHTHVKTLSSEMFWKKVTQKEALTETEKPSNELSEQEMDAWLDIFKNQ
ncbi:NYN domain-containing protein [bacterium]|nr:NYN domain-containing protein [bacterium]